MTPREHIEFYFYNMNYPKWENYATFIAQTSTANFQPNIKKMDIISFVE